MSSGVAHWFDVPRWPGLPGPFPVVGPGSCQPADVQQMENQGLSDTAFRITFSSFRGARESIQMPSVRQRLAEMIAFIRRLVERVISFPPELIVVRSVQAALLPV
jgi:hypothetical protein